MLCLVFGLFLLVIPSHSARITATVASSPSASFAAREIARYANLLDAERNAVPTHMWDLSFQQQQQDGHVVVVADLSTATSRDHFLAMLRQGACEAPTSTLDDAYIVCEPQPGLHLIVGATPAAVLHGAYGYLAMMGVGFSTSGPMLPASAQEVKCSGRTTTPSFTTRGLQPFHDFSEGPDWWSEDEYKRVVENIAQMRGNMIGLHTYPLVEPTVWVGLAADVTADGNVTSGYSTTWSNTHLTKWGYTIMDTSLFPWGAAAMYEHDCFGHPVQSGKPNMCPAPVSAQDEITLFNEVGLLWKTVFSFAHQVSVRTMIGTETPLSTPPAPPGPPPPTTQSYYEGMFTRLTRLLGNTLDYFWVWTPERWEHHKVNITDPLVQDVVKDSIAVQNARDAVNATFQLATCGWVVGPLGARWYFDSVLPSSWLMSSIDMLFGEKPVDPAYANLTHRSVSNKMIIPWSEDDPSLTSPELWLNRTLLHELDGVKYGAGGMMNIHWRTRADSATHGGSHAFAWDPTLTSSVYYLEWCISQFSAAIGQRAAVIFETIDSFNLPKPSTWTRGPGGIVPAAYPACLRKVGPTYSFVDSFVELRGDLLNAIQQGIATAANLESFDYWAYQFSYMSNIAKFECEWGLYNGVIQTISNMTDPSERQAAARTRGFAARASLVVYGSAMMFDLISSATGIEGAGTIHNVMTHSLPAAFGPQPTAVLEGLANESLPSDGFPGMDFDPTRAPSLRMPSPRTILAKGESLRVRVWVLTSQATPPVSVTLYKREMGSTQPYTAVPMTLLNRTRAVYTVESATTTSDSGFEFYVLAVLVGNTTGYTGGLGIPAGTHFNDSSIQCYYPPTAPATPQTVLVMQT